VARGEDDGECSSELAICEDRVSTDEMGGLSPAYGGTGIVEVNGRGLVYA
jgi:hypothetical protein